MARYQHPLSSVKIASPCSANWDDMIGNDCRRFCGQCELNVFNLSDMTKREAEELINQTEGRLCVRFFKRADGTILTSDCPVGLQAIKRRLSRFRTAVVTSILGFLAGVGVFFVGYEPGHEPERQMMGAMVAPKNIVEDTVPMPAVMGGVPAIPRTPNSTPIKKRGKRLFNLRNARKPS